MSLRLYIVRLGESTGYLHLHRELVAFVNSPPSPDRRLFASRLPARIRLAMRRQRLTRPGAPGRKPDNNRDRLHFMSERLSHLDRLEAESPHTIREVAAECRNPVMLHLIGKDPSERKKRRSHF